MTVPVDSRPFLIEVSGAARTLAAALVVLVHVNFLLRPGLETWWPGGLFFAPVFSLTVPLFLILSGFFSAGFGAGTNSLPWQTFAAKTLRRILVPFLIWNTALVLSEAVLNGSTLSTQLIFPLLTGRWQLYYLFVLLQLRTLHYFLSSGLSRPISKTMLLIAAASSFFIYLAADVTLWTRGTEALFFETYINRLFFPWVLFFALGVWIRQDRSALAWLSAARGRLMVLAILSFAAYWGELNLSERLYGCNPLGQTLLAGLFFQASATVLILEGLCRLQAGKKAKYLIAGLKVPAADSYGIYLVHTLILLCLYGLSLPLPIGLEVPVYWVVAFFSALGFVRLVRIYAPAPLAKWLLGEKL